MPEVRFGDLAHGQHFFWRGRAWVKVGPLLAQREDKGDPVMLRRSTRVTVNRETGHGTTALEAHPVPPEAMNRLFDEVSRLTTKLPLEEEVRRRYLSAVRQAFIAALHSTEPRTTDP